MPDRVRRLTARFVLLSGFALTGLPASAVETRIPTQLLSEVPRYSRNARCTEVSVGDVRPRPGTYPLAGLISPSPAESPMSQGDSAICFAYATADMISQRIGVTVSALDVASKYFFADAALLARSKNPALRRYLKDNPELLTDVEEARLDTDVSKAGNPGGLAYFDKLEDGQEDVAALLYNLGGLCEDRDLPSYDGYAQHQSVLRRLRWRSRVVRPRQCFRSLAGTVPHLRGREVDLFNAGWLAYVERRCRRRPLPVPLIPVTLAIADSARDLMERQAQGHPPARAETERLLAVIDYALDHGRMPTISYSWYVLEEKDPKDPDFIADHASPVIARRHVRGGCQYRVQDNTGEYCARMRPGIAERCENGRVWLTEEQLRATLYSVIYLR